MDRDHCLKIHRNVEVGEKTVSLIARFWKQSSLCCRAAGYYSRIFHARRGLTQGVPLSPTIFDLMVDAVLPERIRQGLWDEAYLARMDPEARAAAVAQKVRCELCQIELAVSSLASHLESQHDMWHR